MIAKALQWFGTDGLAHIVCSAALCGLLSLMLPMWVSIVATAAVGIGKELVWDKWLGKGSPSWKDLLCDLIGIALGVL